MILFLEDERCVMRLHVFEMAGLLVIVPESDV